MKTGLAWIGAGLVALVLLAGLILGGWEAGWWFRGQNVNRESHLFRQSYGNQQTLRDQITQRISDVLSISTEIAGVRGDQAEAQALAAQRVAVVNIVCADAAQVVGDPLDTQQAAFVSQNCEAGSISPGSPYNH